MKEGPHNELNRFENWIISEEVGHSKCHVSITVREISFSPGEFDGNLFLCFFKIVSEFLFTSISKYDFFQNSENFLEIKYSRQRVAIKRYSNDYLFSHILSNMQINISYFYRSFFFVFFLPNREFCYLDCTGIGALGRKKEKNTIFIVVLQLSS